MPINPRDSDESSDSAGYYVDKPENKRPLRGVGGPSAPIRGGGGVVRGRGGKYSDSSDEAERPTPSRGGGASSSYSVRGRGSNNQGSRDDFPRESDFQSIRGRGQENYRDKYRGPVRGGEREYQQQQQNTRGTGRNQKVLASSSDEEDRRRVQQQKSQKFDNLIGDQNRRLEEARSAHRYQKERSRSNNKRGGPHFNRGGYQRDYRDQDDEEAVEKDFDPEVYKAEQMMYADQDRNRKRKDYDSMFQDPPVKSGNQQANKVTSRNYYADSSRQQSNPNQDSTITDYDHWEKNLPQEIPKQPMHDDTLLLEDIAELNNALGGNSGKQNKQQQREQPSSYNRGQQREYADGRDDRDRDYDRDPRERTPPRYSGPARGGGYPRDRRDPSPRQDRYDQDHYPEDYPPTRGGYGGGSGGRGGYRAEKDYSSSDSEEQRRRQQEKQAIMNQNFAQSNNSRKKGDKGPRGDNNPNLAKRKPRNPDEPELDERMRILTSFKDFQAPKQGGRIYMPHAIGIASHFEYQGRVIEGTRHYVRGQANKDSEPQRLPQRGEIIKFEAAQQQQNPYENADQYEEMANKLKQMHMSYYKNFEESKIMQ